LRSLNKIAAGLSFIIGAMAVVAGGQVILLGEQMDYYVIGWLPNYNFVVGLISVSLLRAVITFLYCNIKVFYVFQLESLILLNPNVFLSFARIIG